ncbi:MAG: hypothetical protein GX089_15575 [Fibrobacter sp.]|nr:hypothetical protein [Fibrobacter sp.]
MRKKLLYSRNPKSCDREKRVNHARSGSSDTLLPVISREPPGKGFRHFITKKDLRSFIEILPGWPVLFQDLNEIILARGEHGCDGWYTGKVLAISAWESDMWREVPVDYYLEHKTVFFRLGVQCVKQGMFYLCRFNLLSVKAFQLLHIFLHELGHHYDRITSRRMREASRGEKFAEQYADCFQDLIWDKYIEVFGL